MSQPIPTNNNHTDFQMIANEIFPDQALYLEPLMIGNIISAFAYGGVLFLSLSYVPLLLKTSNNISRRMRNFLLVYVTFMVTNSTIYLATMSIDLISAILSDGNVGVPFDGNVDVQFVGVVCTILASWGADGFMLWRCAMLYQGISQGRRITLVAILLLMAIASFGSGLFFIICNSRGPYIIAPWNPGAKFFGPWGPDLSDFLPSVGTTVILNFVTASLITLRILYFDRYIRKAAGMQQNSPYITILIICVESSALIVVSSLIYLIMSLRPLFAASIPMQALVHIYVISPLLIVYRVARGRDVTIEQRRTSESRPVVSALHFQSQALSSSNDDGV